MIRLIIIIVFVLIFILTYRRMITSIVRTDDSIQESNITAWQPCRAPIT